MTKFKEILRLQQQGLSQRQIAASLRISRNTIKEFFRRLELSDLSLPLNEHLSDQDIWNALYGTKSEGNEYQKPDYDWVAKEMRHKGVTLLSLWGSYRLTCKEMHVQAYGYTQFCKRYSDYVNSQNTTMSIPRNPGENTEVDWAGSTLFLQDPITGDAVPVYLFAATLSYSGYSYFEGFLNMKSPAWISGNVNSVSRFLPKRSAWRLATGSTAPCIPMQIRFSTNSMTCTRKIGRSMKGNSGISSGFPY